MSSELGWHYSFVTVMEQVPLRLIYKSFLLMRTEKMQ